MKVKQCAILLFTGSLIAIAAILTGSTSCSPKTQSPQSGGDSLVAYLERTPCFGKCPWYSIRVYQSGYAVYDGKRDAPRTGKYFTRISRQQLESIGKKAEALKYFELNNEYRNDRLTDFPTVYVEVRYKGKKKAITHYEANPPQALTEMEDFIDQVFVESNWQQISDGQQGE